MRKITEQAVSAFYNPGKGMSNDNTVVMSDEYGAVLILHGSHIAELDRQTNVLTLSSCGFRTNTTKDRLNGILGYIGKLGIYQRKGIWYIGNNIEFYDGIKINLDTKEVIQ